MLDEQFCREHALIIFLSPMQMPIQRDSRATMPQAVLQLQSKARSGGSAPPAIILCWQLACMSCDIAGCPLKSIRWVLGPTTTSSLHHVHQLAHNMQERVSAEGIECCPVGALGLLLLQVSVKSLSFRGSAVR